MTRSRVPLFCTAVVLLALGCSPADRGGPAAPETPAGAPPATTSTGLPSTATPSRVAQPTPPAPARTAYRVTYGWAVPSSPARVAHTVRVPVVPPPGPPLPTLTEIEVGDHPDENYTRLTFAFAHATPAYELAYVPRIESEGSGDPVPLAGNAFLRVRFDQAQAHDERGSSTIIKSPIGDLGYPTLRCYGFGGDFEGYLTYGLGIQVAGGSDQVLPIRAGELIRPDGLHVVAIDVRRG